MKLYIPEIGTKMALTQDWKFTLFVEDRNIALTNAAGFNNDYFKRVRWHVTDKEALRENISLAKVNGWKVISEYDIWNMKFHKDATLPFGSVLTVDRIYIRKGVSDYSSVSFNLDRESIDSDHSEFANNLRNSKGRCRFWAKLPDVNQIEFTLV